MSDTPPPPPSPSQSTPRLVLTHSHVIWLIAVFVGAISTTFLFLFTPFLSVIDFVTFIFALLIVLIAVLIHILKQIPFIRSFCQNSIGDRLAEFSTTTTALAQAHPTALTHFHWSAVCLSFLSSYVILVLHTHLLSHRSSLVTACISSFTALISETVFLLFALRIGSLLFATVSLIRFAPPPTQLIPVIPPFLVALTCAAAAACPRPQYLRPRCAESRSGP